MTDGLKDRHRDAIIALLAANDRVEKAVLFGSRAMRTGTDTSDVDIALFGDRLSLTDQARLAEAIGEIPMAQSVDLVLHHTIDHQPLLDHIRTHGVEWYRRPESKADSRLHLRPEHRRTLKKILREHLPGVEVWAYGSRVNGRSHDGSDLDLVFRGPGLEEVPIGELGDFEEAVREATLPFMVEARDWARLPEQFRREIEREHVVLSKNAHSEKESRTLGDYFTIQRGTTYNSRLLGQDGPTLLGRASIHRNGGFRSDALRTYGGECPEKLLVCPGQIYVSLKDVTQSADLLGAVARLPVNLPPGRLTQDTVKLKPKDEGIDLDFIYWTLRTPEYRHYCHSHATGTTNLGLSRDDFLAYPIPMQTLTRCRIVETLTALDDKIELNRRMNETLEAMARAIFKDWFVGFGPTRAKMEGRAPYLAPELWDLFPDRLVNSELGEVPTGWTVSDLGEVVKFAYGKALKAKARDAAGKIPVFGSNGQIGWHDQALVERPGIIVGRKGNPGTVTLSLTEFFPIDTTFYVVPKHEYDKCLYFLLFALQAQDLPSVAADSAVPGLNRNLAYMNRQIRPPRAVAECFDEYVNAMYARRRQITAESRFLVILRDALLPKLISGEIRLRDAETAIKAVAR